jgi:predicted DNA-binding transcriptional regulator AlpA
MNQEQNPRRQLLRKREVAAMLGVSTWTIDSWVEKQILPAPIFITAGSPGMWRLEWIEAVIDRAQRRRRRLVRNTSGLKRGLQRRRRRLNDTEECSA